MTCSFKVGNTYKTKDGPSVLVVYVDDSMILGVCTPENGMKSGFCWRENGLYSDRRLEFMDLVPPEAIIKRLWMHVYRSAGTESGYYGCLSTLEGGARPITLDIEGYIGTFPFSFKEPEKE